MRDIEIQQQADLEPSQLQIREQLSLMHRSEVLDGLKLHDQVVLDEQIDSVADFELYSIIGYR